MHEAWLKREIAAGVSGLLALRLDGSPAADAMVKTAEIWLIAMTKGREWKEEQDSVRIRKAFETLFATCERWPPPALLLRELPVQPVEQRQIKHKRTEEQIRTGNKALDQITAGMKRRANPDAALKTDNQIEETKRQAMAALAELQDRANKPMNMEQHQ
ncbi:hypothetical protein [Pseudomonas sp. NPDC090201]|uniref:hypothetical protein n=1 Tax=Pseudomonas sp. NPDC090201 TaxID=3364475 RepID=UPI0037F9E8FA